MKKWLEIGVVALLFLVVTGLVGFRWWRADPVRSFYCRVAPCAVIDDLDAVCGTFALAEFRDLPDRAALLQWVGVEARSVLETGQVTGLLERILADPAPERYHDARELARSEGAPRWTCPPMERAVSVR